MAAARDGRGVGADGAQAVVDFGQAVRGRRFRPRRAGRGVRGRLAGRCRAGWRGRRGLPARRWRCARAAARRMSPPSSGMSPAMARSSGGLAGAVAADQADAAAGVDGQVGAVQQRAAAQADGDGGDDEEGHGGGVIGPEGARGQGWGAGGCVAAAVLEVFAWRRAARLRGAGGAGSWVCAGRRYAKDRRGDEQGAGDGRGPVIRNAGVLLIGWPKPSAKRAMDAIGVFVVVIRRHWRILRECLAFLSAWWRRRRRKGRWRNSRHASSAPRAGEGEEGRMKRFSRDLVQGMKEAAAFCGGQEGRRARACR